MRTLLALLLTLLCADAAIPPISTWDYQVRDWARNRVVTNSSTISASSYVKATEYMLYLRFTGLRRQIVWSGVYLGDGLNALSAPFIIDITSAGTIDQLINFVGGDFTEATGLTGDGTTKVLACGQASGLRWSQFTTLGNMHLAVYNRTPGNSAANYLIMGEADGVAGPAQMIISHTTGTYIQMGAGTSVNTNDASGLGLYVCCRTSTTFAAMYRNGVLLISDGGTATGVGDWPIAVHGREFNGLGYDSYSNRALCFYSVGFGMSAAQAFAYQLAVERLQRRMGRSVL